MFGLRAPVDRKTYLLAGFSLMALKYGIDAGIVYGFTGRQLSPWIYLLPSLVLRESALGSNVPTEMHAAMALVALPFLWVGLAMSIRRAVDAGVSPWVGTAFLVPILNIVTIAGLSVVPSATASAWEFPPGSPFRGTIDTATSKAYPGTSILATVSGTALGLGMTAFSVFALRSYGTALFLLTPFAMGALTAVVLNRKVMHSYVHTLTTASLTLILAASAILLFAIEGVLCLLMALPIALVLVLAGATVGYLVTRLRRANCTHVAASLLVGLPGFATLETRVTRPTLREAVTVIEIDAPPEVVWHNVVSFSDLPAPPEWFFRLGIAYPLRARIVGEGVGAVRHCEFSTGPFVEPITRWESPTRLSFDVTSQPPSMKELSPYRHVDAPHLEGYMVSRRGEFRLTALPHGRTRLEGSTWYTLAIYPEAYWVIGGELLLHAIHTRVLSHIKVLSESAPPANP